MQWQNTSNKGYIREIFTSIQGEGKYVGALQLFVRFSGCSIGCESCDTDFDYKEFFDFDGKFTFVNPIDAENLAKYIYEYIKPNEIHSISITGGEPLVQLEFLKELCNILKNLGFKIFLETSGFLLDRLNDIGDFVDIVSLDFKLKSTFGVEFSLNELKKIDERLLEKIYVKIVLKEGLDDLEFRKVVEGLKILKKKEIYLHFLNNSFKIDKTLFSRFYSSGVEIFFVPQLHKLLEIR